MLELGWASSELRRLLSERVDGKHIKDSLLHSPFLFRLPAKVCYSAVRALPVQAAGEGVL